MGLPRSINSNYVVASEAGHFVFRFAGLAKRAANPPLHKVRHKVR